MFSFTAASLEKQAFWAWNAASTIIPLMKQDSEVVGIDVAVALEGHRTAIDPEALAV